MKRSYLVAIVASICISSVSYAADDGESLFKSSGCSTCHAADKTTIGPSLKDIAAKYAADSNAEGTLEKKVRDGGSGSFANMMMPMPPTPASISDASIKTMVAWVLGHK
ncbi:MAG: c-type cytochrome [Gallionella sp.]